ncbi:MAG: DUF1810 domain-containing protein [Gammaproteobacteria bacterium]|nr:DUF1810 domain-containing protein [Gammaproteobacteria bacterium]
MGNHSSHDTFHLDRFLEAQEGIYEMALSELGAGKKRSHWMWFVFPQMAGLGSSPAASYFGIKSVDEARAYLEHPLLGERIKACTDTLLGICDRSAVDIFGYPDHLKFCSSMTLFDYASPDNNHFGRAIIKYCQGVRDSKTLDIIGMERGA